MDDQDEALAFYTEVLGFEKKTEIPLGEARWLTVVSPGDPDGTELVLEPSSHPAVAPFKEALVADGIPFTSFAVDDVHAEFERLRVSVFVSSRSRSRWVRSRRPSSTTRAATCSRSRRRSRSVGHDRGVVIARFVDACAADDRIVAAFLAGSYATGTADAYSDLDLGVITTDAAYADVIADRRALIGRLGEPLFLDDFGRAWNVFFILADGTEGEIFFGARERWRRSTWGRSSRSLDERGILAGAEFPFSPPDADEQGEHLRQIVNWFWHELSHFITALGLGDLWWAYGQLEAMRGHCVNLMRIQHGAEAQDEPYKKLAKAIPVSELARFGRRSARWSARRCSMLHS